MSDYSGDNRNPAVVWACNEFRIVRQKRESMSDAMQYVFEEYDGDDEMGRHRFQAVTFENESFQKVFKLLV